MLEEAVKLIKDSKHMIVLTGAGISTNAGIPDYRSKNGIYSNDKGKIFTEEYFNNNKVEFYNSIKDLLKGKVPTESHCILGKWLVNDKVKTIYTQNIDRLHELSIDYGSIDTECAEDYYKYYKKIKHVHGKCNIIYCKACGKKKLLGGNFNIEKAKCECGKTDWDTDMVLFGQEPKVSFEDEMNLLNSDLLLILGTSGEVSTLHHLIQSAPHAKRIYVNLDQSETLDKICDIVIHEDIDNVLNTINRKILQESE